MSMGSDFYLRYYVGHKGKFGHEFLEFEFRPDGEPRRGCEGERVAQGAGFSLSLSVCFVFSFLLYFNLLV